MTTPIFEQRQNLTRQLHTQLVTHGAYKAFGITITVDATKDINADCNNHIDLVGTNGNTTFTIAERMRENWKLVKYNEITQTAVHADLTAGEAYNTKSELLVYCGYGNDTVIQAYLVDLRKMLTLKPDTCRKHGGGHDQRQRFSGWAIPRLGRHGIILDYWRNL